MNSNTLLVVMPVYNAEETLSSAIESILTQEHKDLHLTIVDDCSTDGSLEIAKQYLSDPRVTIYKNKKNMGAYFSRNLGLYVNKDRSWKYFTTHDADDVSYPQRYTILTSLLQGSAAAVQDSFVRKDLATRKHIKAGLTLAHAAFSRRVFDDVGYFDNVRFAGDWEHWERVKRYARRSRLTMKSYAKTLGESYIHDKNLTVLVPVGSTERQDYVRSALKALDKMSVQDEFYRGFDPENLFLEIKPSTPDETKKNNDIAKAPKISVVILTWNRIRSLKKTLEDLRRQTHKDFDVYISNANDNMSSTVDQYAKSYRRFFNVTVSHDGNDYYSFRRFFVAEKLARSGTDIVFFLDDDIEIPKNYIKKALMSYEPKTYSSCYAWRLDNRGSDYYKHRTRVYTNKEKIHYCGAGVSMVDASLFLGQEVFDAPKEAHKIEDLWLSFVVDRKRGWKMKYMDIPGVVIGGNDPFALHKEILKGEYDKTDFLRDLVQRGWKI
jgi:glycosyltransferase involved in cell wall biosynthesis